MKPIPRWLLLLMAALPNLLAAQDAMLVTNARVITGTGAVLESATLSVSNGRILAVLPSTPEPIPVGTRVIDARGKTVMPALIDGHAHLGYQSHTSWHGDNYTRENLLDNLDQYAWYGFAAVFSAGSDADDLALAIQADQAAGRVGGARLLFAAGMAPPGQGPNNQFLEHTNAVAQRTGMTVLRGLATPTDASVMADAIAGKGIRFIKIWVDDRNGSQDKLAPSIFTPLIQRAHAHGIPVFVHQQFPSDMPALLDAGIDGFLHGRLDDLFTQELAEATARQGAFVVPNIGLAELRREAIGADPFLRAVLADAADRLDVGGQRLAQPALGADAERQLQAAMARLQDAGVEIVLGSDAGGVADHPFGYSAHRELEIYVRLGLTPAEALAAGTRVAAERLGLTDLGTLEPGKSADFLILSGNPLDDIRNTRRIEQVFLRGQPIDRAALQARWQSQGNGR